jgi:hypothetical protein
LRQIYTVPFSNGFLFSVLPVDAALVQHISALAAADLSPDRSQANVLMKLIDALTCAPVLRIPDLRHDSIPMN